MEEGLFYLDDQNFFVAFLYEGVDTQYKVENEAG